MADKSNVVAVVISGLALAGSVLGLVINHNAVQIQEIALKDAQERWEAEAANFQVSGHLGIFDSSAQTWGTHPAPGTNIPDESLNPPQELYAIITATNQGRFVGGIKEIGFYKADNVRVPVTNVTCSDVGVTELASCSMPRKLEPAQAVEFYASLGEFIKSDFQCNDYLKQGIKFYVTALDGVSYDADTGTAVASSSYCPTLTPRP